MALLDGKVAIVTGGGQGIGRHEALLLARHGAHVVVNDYAPRGASGCPADDVVSEIAEFGGTAEANADDIGTWEGGRNVVGQALERTGNLDILLCNAGIVRDRMSFMMDESEWDDVVRVHLKGHFAPTRFAAEHWRKRSKAMNGSVNGRLIYTTSEAGMYGNIGQPNYSAAKAGITGLCLEVSRELEPYGVTVNTISPRGRTPMTLSTFGSVDAPPDGFDPWDAANIAPWPVFLSTDAAAQITGQIFVVFGATVQLMDPWTIETKIENDKMWEVEELMARAEDLIPGLKKNLPPFPVVVPTDWKPGS